MSDHDVEIEEGTLQHYEHHFAVLQNTIGSGCAFDGMCVVVREEDGSFLIVTDDAQWRELTLLPQSLIASMFETPKAAIVSDLEEHTLFNPAFDSAGNTEACSLLLYPLVDDGATSMVFSLWKEYQRETDEVIEPLIIGSQMVGATTKVERRRIAETFQRDDIDRLEGLQKGLRQIVQALVEQIRQQKRALVDAVSSHEKVFHTPQEIVAALMNVLMGTGASVANLKEIVEQVRGVLHRSDKIVPQIDAMYAILQSLDTQLLQTFEFGRNNDIMQMLFQGKKKVHSERFFVRFHAFMLEGVCAKALSFNFFLSPHLPLEIQIEQQHSYLFLTQLLRFALEDAQEGKAFDIRIAEGEPGMVVFHVAYEGERRDVQEYRKLFLQEEPENLLSKPLLLAYKKFVQTGAKLSVGMDAKSKRVSFQCKIPFDVLDMAPIVETLPQRAYKVGILFDKHNDLNSVNTIARYALALGLPKSSLLGAEKMGLFPKDITHLILFQSKFTKELFEQEIQEIDAAVMLMSNGCKQREEVDFYDYSMVDYDVDRESYYLHDIKEFLAMGGV